MRLKKVTGFRMLQQFERGQDLLPFVQAIRAIGGNGARVLTQFSWLDDPLPPVPAATIAAFVKWMGEQGLYVGLTIGADCATYDPAKEGRTGFGQSRAWLAHRIADVTGHVSGAVNVDVEGCNEPGKNLPADCADIWDVVTDLGLQDPRNRPVLMGTGEYTIVGKEGTFDALDLMYDHGERKPDWPGEAGKLGHFVYDGWPEWKGFHGRDVHVSEDEPMGCAEAPSGSRDTNPDNFEDAGAGYGMGNGSLTFHWQYGIDGVLGPVQLACGQKWFAGAEFFPADACLGRYTHQDLADFPLVSDYRCSEAAGRLVSDTQAFVVVAQPTAGWTAVPRNGWRIVRTGGRGNLLELAR